MHLATCFTVLSATFLSTLASGSVDQSSLQICATGMDGKLPSNVPSDFFFSGKVRRYYVAAEQVQWNYAPSGWDSWMGVPLNVSTNANLSGYSSPGLGYVWQKALYRGYTDAQFNNYSHQAPTNGAQGPTLRAEVGDMIEILFLNKLSDNYASMHSMGLAYSKMSEGSDYFPDNTTTTNHSTAFFVGDAVPPRKCAVMKWLVNEGSAPTGDAVSQMWAYHSYVTMREDFDAGLVGSTIVYSRGMMNKTMTSHREFTLAYIQYNEANSFMSKTNAENFNMSGSMPLAVKPITGQGYGNESFWLPQVTNLASSKQLSSTKAPKFDTLNGYIYANNYPFEVCVDDPTIWYLGAWGSSSHTFHMHGNGFKYMGINRATIGLTPGTMLTLTSTMTGAGAWQLICHVDNHQSGGMIDNYIVYPQGQCNLPKLQ